MLGGLGLVIAIVWALTIKRPEQAGWLRSQEREYILENRSVISAPSDTFAGVGSMSLPTLLRRPLCGGC